MSALKVIARIGLHRAGGMHLPRRFRKGVRILTYHRFPAGDMDRFDRQCRHLRKAYEPVSMGDIAASLQTGKPLPANAVAITVDDGYKDFSECAAPVLKAHGLPATVFLVSSFLDRVDALWWDPLLFAMNRTALSRIQFGDFGIVRTSTVSEREAAFEFVVRKLKGVPNHQRLSMLAETIESLDVPMPRGIPAGCEPMNWDEARLLRKHGIEFGGHTRTHPILSQLETQAELTEEIVSCKQRMEQELGETPLHFAYPNGEAEDFSDAVVAAVKAAEFKTGVTTLSGLNSPCGDPFRLQRIVVDSSFPQEYFEEAVAGIH